MNALKAKIYGLSQGEPWALKKSADSFPIALLGFAQICSWGTLYYSFPQLAQAMLSEFNWAKSETYGALSISLLFSSFAAIPVGKLIDNGYGRNVMVIGSIVAGVLLIAGSQINSLSLLYGVFAAIGIVQATTLYEAAFAVINANHQHEEAKGKIVTLTLWGGFASTVFIPFIELLIIHFSWRITFVVLGAVNMFVCSICYGLLPRGIIKTKDTKVVAQADSRNINVAWALKQPIFWALLLCFSLFAAGASTFKFHLYPILVESALSPQQVVLILAVLGPAQVLGRVALKFAGAKVSALQLGVLTTSALPITFVGMVYLPSQVWLLIPLITLFGAATGMMTIVKGIAIPELLTKEAYGAINGAMSMPIQFIKAGAPAIAAWIWMITQSYDMVLLVLGGIGIVAVACFVLVRQFAHFSR
ncbi:MFS transporter [Pseudoalteromonas luteoviolacea]|uniref:MFS transporter n=1 Tax=Pseudoalteromonas luteoviolacea TaxID=43657 RepID=UPI001B37BA64|nr:MFS transporter [Pseudoalteromonas luteoviolacea]MBQ4837885.1 MFS transporter [Pseudoalteromonas luteoviolacea]